MFKLARVIMIVQRLGNCRGGDLALYKMNHYYSLLLLLIIIIIIISLFKSRETYTVIKIA